MYDRFQRKIEYLRISVTDLCNLRCRYCMPEHGVRKLRHEDILTYEELLVIVRAMARLGVRKVRLTGGEPLVRAGIVDFVGKLKEIRGIEQVAMTTNGVLLSAVARDLRAAGLDSVNVSLDALSEDTFSYLAGRPGLSAVQEGMEALFSAGFCRVKVNCVPLAGVNGEDVPKLAGLAKERDIRVRFIELMPIGCAFETGLRGIPMEEVRRRLIEEYGPLVPAEKEGSLAGPAEYFRLPGFRGQVGFIDAMGHKFCASCNRIRLTAEGFLKLCLHGREGLDLRRLLRGGISAEGLECALAEAVHEKPEEHSFLAGKGEASGDMRYMYQVGG